MKFIAKCHFSKITENAHWEPPWKAAYMLLKSDVTRRDHMSVVMDAGSRIVNIIVNFIRDGTVFA